MVYQYVAYNEEGAVVKGKLSAASEEAVAKLLDYAGYHVINIEPFESFLHLDKLQARLSRVKPAEIILFYRQLALLLESGIDIVTSLDLLRGQASNRALKKVLGEIIADIRGGNQLSVALGKHPRIFPPLYCRALHVGEQTGNLEIMLRQIADYVEKKAVATKSLKAALMYPIFTVVVAIVVIGILVTVVLPAFGNLYTSLGAELPLMTKMLLGIADKLQSYGIYILLTVFIIAGLAFAYVKTPDGRYKWDRLLLRLPLVGRVNHLNELARCCRSIALLFRAGLSLTEILPVVIQGSGNRDVAEALTNVYQDMLKGEGLSKPMAKHDLFLPMMVQMVRVGEETGNLDTTLLAVAQNYETEVEDRSRSLIGFIQPAMTLIIGLVIGFITLSLISAMYSLYGQAL